MRSRCEAQPGWVASTRLSVCACVHAYLSEESSIDDVMEIYEINDRIRVSSNARREDDDLVVVREGDEEDVEERPLEDVEHPVRLLRVDLHPTIVLRDGLISRVHQRLVEIQYQLHSQTHINTERRAVSRWPLKQATPDQTTLSSC